jgi:hypothetical protein
MPGENTDGFESVVVTDSDLKGLIIPDEVQSKTPEKIEEAKTGDEKKTESGDDEQHANDTVVPVKIKVKDDEFTEDELESALADRRQKNLWEKSHTEESQKLAAARKAIEPVLKFVEKLKADGEFLADIKESAVDRFGDEFAGIIDAAIQMDPEKVPNPFKDELAAAQRERDDARKERDDLKSAKEAEAAISAEMKTLRETHKLSEKQAGEVLEFATKKFEETGQAVSLEDAWKLMDYENQVKKAEAAKTPKIHRTPDAGTGAKDIKNKNAGTFDEIKMDGYKLFE